MVDGWSVIAGVAGVVAVIVTVVYGEIERRTNRKQLRIAQEEAELRPRLSVSLREVVPQPRPDNAGWLHDKVAIVFNVTNEGKSAAHNVRCDVHLDERHFAPDGTFGQNYDFFAPHLGPFASQVLQRNVEVLSYGRIEARYTCACDEVGKTEGTVEFEVSERRQKEGSG